MLFIDHKLVSSPTVWTIKAKFPETANEVPALTPPPLAHVEAPC